MNWKRALVAFVVSLLVNKGLTTSGICQETERDPGQASVLLRGIVTDELGKPIVGATVDTIRYDGEVSVGTKSTEGR